MLAASRATHLTLIWRHPIIFDGCPPRTNADIGAREVLHFRALDGAGDTLMRAAIQQVKLSARSYYRILKLSRTIAGLAGEPSIQSHHLAEPLQYRPKVAV